MDRVLFQMPRFEYLLPAISLAQGYISHQYYLLAQRQKTTPPSFTIAVSSEDHLFLSPMFPNMEVTLVDGELKREDWDCTIDMRDIDRVYRVAWPTRKHVTEAWGAMFGASTQMLPALGPIAITCQNPTYDFLIDAEVPNSQEIVDVVDNYSGFTAHRVAVNNERVCTQFQLLADCKVYVGYRSGATYLAATMRKGCIEIWPTDMPLWFLSKPQSEGFKTIIGNYVEKDIVLEQIKLLMPVMAKAA